MALPSDKPSEAIFPIKFILKSKDGVSDWLSGISHRDVVRLRKSE